MIIDEIIGEYTLIGSNQDEEENTYKGTLSLSLDSDNRITAEWVINNDQRNPSYKKTAVLIL